MKIFITLLLISYVSFSKDSILKKNDTFDKNLEENFTTAQTLSLENKKKYDDFYNRFKSPLIKNKALHSALVESEKEWNNFVYKLVGEKLPYNLKGHYKGICRIQLREHLRGLRIKSLGSLLNPSTGRLAPCFNYQSKDLKNTSMKISQALIKIEKTKIINHFPFFEALNAQEKILNILGTKDNCKLAYKDFLLNEYLQILDEWQKQILNNDLCLK